MSNETETFDPNQIMQHIQNQIQQAEQTQPKLTVRNAKRTYPAKPADIPYNLTLYAYLDTTKTLIPAYSTALQRKQNSLTNLPIIGRAIQAMQTQVHQVALFYTNRTLRHQQEVNDHLLACIEQLTIEAQKQQRMISELQEQIDSLEKESAT